MNQVSRALFLEITSRMIYTMGSDVTEQQSGSQGRNQTTFSGSPSAVTMKGVERYQGMRANLANLEEI